MPTSCRRAAVSPVIILMIAVVVILVILAIAFLPFGTTSYSETRTVPVQAGVDHAVINISSDIGGISVLYQPLSGSLVEVHISAETSAGLLSKQNLASLFNITFNYTVVGDTVYVKADVKTQATAFLSSIQNLSVVIDVDPSLATDINASTAFGGITLVSGSGIKIDSVDLSTTTGGVSADLVAGTVLGGDLDLKAETGGVQLLWNDVNTTTGVSVNAATTTGGVDIKMSQSGGLQGDVAVTGTTITGAVNFGLSIGGDVGAQINSTVTAGGMNIAKQDGFAGTNDLLNSTNYPAGDNFEVSLHAAIGGIDISAVYQP